MVGVSGTLNLLLHHKVQKFSSGTGSPGWFKGCKMVVVAYTTACELQQSFCRLKRFGLFSWKVTCHFLFAVHGNYVPNSYHFQDRARYWSKFTDFSRSQFANFPHFTCIWCLLVWHHVDFTKIFSVRNTTVSSLPCSVDCLMISTAICTHYQRVMDRQTRQMEQNSYISIALCIAVLGWCAMKMPEWVLYYITVQQNIHCVVPQSCLTDSPIMLNSIKYYRTI